MGRVEPTVSGAWGLELATVEFTDLAAAGATAGAKALVDVVAYKNADALVHVLATSIKLCRVDMHH